jgi:hypothetical protein
VFVKTNRVICWEGISQDYVGSFSRIPLVLGYRRLSVEYTMYLG